MVGKIVNTLNSMNSFSKKIIVTISIISLALCLSGVGIIIYNYFTYNTIALHNIASTMIHSAIVIYAQFITVSLAIDFFNTIIHSNDD